jgi:hypothetical protein
MSHGSYLVEINTELLSQIRKVVFETCQRKTYSVREIVTRLTEA